MEGHGQFAAATTPRVVLGIGVAYLVWLTNGFYLHQAARFSVGLFWALDLLQWIVMPALLWWLCMAPAGVRFQDVGFARRRRHWLEAMGEVTSVFLTSGLLFFLVRALARPFFAGSPFSIADAFPPDGPLRLLALAYAALTAGFVESVIFLGLPWLLWRNTKAGSTRAWVFVMLVSVLFALAHWEHGAATMLGAFATHAMSCVWFFHYKSLWPVAVSHVLVDVIAFA